MAKTTKVQGETVRWASDKEVKQVNDKLDATLKKAFGPADKGQR
jgi:hypothetical protein